MIPIIDVHEKIRKGPVIEERKFDKRILPKKIKELVEEYDINYSGNPIPTDDSVVDNVFEAGKRLLLDVGFLCLNNNRIINFSEEEIDKTLRAAPNRLTVGRGKHSKEIKARKLGDKQRPWLCPGPSGMPISEDLAVSVPQSIAQQPLAEGFWTGTIDTFKGTMVTSGRPTEILASEYEISSAKEGVRKAGKSGLPILGGMTPLTSGAFIASISNMESGDCILTSAANELKVNFNILSKVTFASRQRDINLFFDETPLLGGYVGGPEGCAITSVASEIGCLALGADFSGGNSTDMLTATNSSRETLWAANVFLMSMTRNASALEFCYHFAGAGPSTKMLLYEAAAKTLSAAISGYEMICSPMAGAANNKNFISPLEFRFSSEVADVAAKMKRNEANDIVGKILQKYEENLKDPPKGKQFTDCMNTETLQPSEEWLQLYNEVKGELRDIGLKIS